jgi:signal transduction histidine kinase
MSETGQTDGASAAMPAELACRPLKSLLVHFRHTYGQERLREVLAAAHLPPQVDGEFLESENNWVSFEVGQRVMDTLAEASGDPQFPRKAGLVTMQREVLGVAYGLLRAFGTPKMCYRRTLENSALYNRVGTYGVERLGRRRVTFTYRSRVKEPNRRFCEYRTAQFESFPTLWGLPPARAREVTCQVAGAACCSYEFEWINRSIFPFTLVGAAAVGLTGLALNHLGLVASTPGVLAAITCIMGGLLGALVNARMQIHWRDGMIREQGEDVLRSVSDLWRRFEEIQRLNQSLEEKVRERTQELENTTRQLEVALERQLELDQLKTKFFTNVNHDLRSPLTVIVGTIGTLLRDPQVAANPERLSKLLHMTQRSASRLESMIDDLLELSSIDAGVGKLQLAPVDLRGLIEELVQTHRAYASSLGIELVDQLPDSPLPLNVDAKKIERVVTNLVNNALKFSSPGTRVAVGLEESSLGARITVADEGPGILPEDHSRIFERFNRGSGAQRHSASGTGLGLAVVKEFTELHRGRVSVESTPGEGATFIVDLPRGLRADDGDAPQSYAG